LLDIIKLLKNSLLNVVGTTSIIIIKFDVAPGHMLDKFVNPFT
jgi:hypothetical protein